MATSQKEYRLLLIGNSGAGKSTFGNFLLDKDAFSTELAFGAITGSAAVSKGVVEGDRVCVIDTPGICEAYELLNDKEGLTEMSIALILAAEGVDAIAYIMSPSDRFMQFQQRVLEHLAKCDTSFWSRIVLVFSNASSLGRNREEQRQHIKNMLQKPLCPSYFKWLMGNIRERYVMFEASESVKPEYRVGLLKEIMEHIRQINMQPYQNKLMAKIAKLMTPSLLETIRNAVYNLVAKLRSWDVEQPHDGGDKSERPSPKLVDKAVGFLTQELQRALQEQEGCFPGEAKVVTTEGIKKIENLSPKDKVMCLKPDGNISFSKILTFLHCERGQSFRYLNIQTEEGSKILISPCHLIFASSKADETSGAFVFASELKLGDFVLSVSSRTKQLEKVRSVTSIVRDSVFAPLTANGTIVVDDIYVSCYAHIDSHTMAHGAFLPLRILTAFGRANIYHPKNGIHKYASFLKNVKL